MAGVVRGLGAGGIRSGRCGVALPGRCPVPLHVSGAAAGRVRAAGPRKPCASDRRDGSRL